MGFLGCEISEMWDVQDVECWGCGMLGMWDVWGVACGMWDVECFAGMWDINLQNDIY